MKHKQLLLVPNSLDSGGSDSSNLLPSTLAPKSEDSLSRPGSDIGHGADRLSPSDFSRDEMNLVEFPLAVLSTRVNNKVKTLEFSDVQRLRTGQVIEKEWIITGADKFGLPTATDDDVVLGLMKLSYAQDFKDRKVFFSRYELLKTLRWSTEGRSYSRLTKSLDRLSGVRIRTRNGFFDNEGKSYQTRNFGIIDAYEINDSRGGKTLGIGEGKKKSFFIWSEVLFNSFQASYIKKIDLELYFALKSAVSRRLYRYLDKHTYRTRKVEKPLMTLAFEKLGLSRSYKYLSSIKQQLQPALKELVSVGYLEGFEYTGRGSQTKIRLIRAASGAHPLFQRTEEQFAPKTQPRLTNPNPSPSTSSSRVDSLTQSLAERGLSEAQATRLLSGKTDSVLVHVGNIITYYDALVKGGDKRVSRNPVGFLYRAVENPEKFNVPTSEISNTASKRPERALLNKGSAAVRHSSQTDSEEEAYRVFIGREIARLKGSLTASQLQQARTAAEKNMFNLKDILGRVEYKSGLNQCVKKEITAMLGLPSFHEWRG